MMSFASYFSRGYSYLPLANGNDDEKPSDQPTFVWTSWRPSTRQAKLALLALISILLVALLATTNTIKHGLPLAASMSSFPSYNKQQQPVLATNNSDTMNLVSNNVDWNKFAYVQYVTNYEYLCNSVMLFESLDRLGCRASRLMMYPKEFEPSPDTIEGRLLEKARSEYGVKLQPVDVQRQAVSDPTWAESTTKLLAMNQTGYDRVLSLDSDSTVLQCLDELFLLPPAQVAMPRAYWEWPKKFELSSQLLLLETSTEEFDRVMDALSHSDAHTFDMDILNTVYNTSAMILPHREYDLITGEFRSKTGEPKDHSRYLGRPHAKWDAKEVLRKAKFLHFSDWPVPKPWLPISKYTLEESGPKCIKDNCDDRDAWLTIFGDFKRRRLDVCGIEVGGAIKDATLEL